MVRRRRYRRRISRPLKTVKYSNQTCIMTYVALADTPKVAIGGIISCLKVCQPGVSASAT